MKIIVSTVLLVITILFSNECNAQWTPLLSNWGQSFITAISFNDSSLFVGTSWGNVYVSTNSGTTWQYYNRSQVWPPGYGGDATGFEFIKNKIFATNYGGGISWSDDNGVSWHIINNGFSAGKIIISLISIGDTLFAGTRYCGGIYESTDFGQNWIQSNNGIENPYSSAFTSFSKRGEILFTCDTESGIYRSTDKGNLWELTTTEFNSRIFLDVVAGKDFIFAGTDSGVYRSSNNGDSWEFSGLKELAVIKIAVDQSEIYAATENGLFLSEDNGINWDPISNGLENQNFWSLAVNQNEIVVGSQGAGAFLSTDKGNNWKDINTGISNLIINAFSFTQSADKDTTTIFAAVRGDGILITNDNSFIWKTLYNNYPNSNINTLINIPSKNKSGNILLAAVKNEGIFRSIDDGHTWQKANNGLSNLNVNTITYGLINNNLDTLFIAATDSGIYRSNNFGDSWITSDEAIKITDVHDICFNGMKLYAGTRNKGVFISTDFGITWSGINNGLNETTINSITIENNILLVGTDIGVYMSEGGIDWTKISFGLPICKVNKTLIYENIFIAGTDSGLFVSNNYGQNWRPVNYGFRGTYQSTKTDTRIIAMIICNNNLIVGTDGDGVFSRPLSEITNIELDNNILPDQVRLFQNYPNPFNPSTKINYEIPKSGLVTIKIYDVLGKEIETLVNEEKNPGRYKVDFDGSNLSSGVYFYKITTNKFSETKKMLLMK